MGICCGIKSSSQIEYIDFHSRAKVRIIEKNNRGHFKGTSEISFSLLPPIFQQHIVFNISPNTFRACSCVLPGQDPRSETEKECQDTCSFSTKSDLFFGVLFDGHGKFGKQVSTFCQDFMLNFFNQNTEKFLQSPITAIEELVCLCEDQLKSSGIDSKLSGSTAIIILLSSSGVHIGSLGDSRAILASLPKDNLANLFTPAFTRSDLITPSRLLVAIPLTIDHKPNHEEELTRIQSAGGIVERVTNNLGDPIGPYRVWKRLNKLPGLAMSRSIGDTIAHEVGVISTPIINSFDFYPTHDQFIVIASDGIWDVMDNLSVVNLVEKFRNSAAGKGSSYPARLSNSSIARILCEEARYRWLNVVEDEDVMIDDMSCIVIELSSVEPWKGYDHVMVKERKVDRFKSLVIKKQMDIIDAVAVRKDIVRGSVLEISGNDERIY